MTKDTNKLVAEWFWIDRWMGSSAFGLNLEARGLYREMLTQAWRRGGWLPNDHDQIRRFVGVTKAEWKRTWRFVEHYWRVDGDRLVNDTQLEVYADAQGRQQRATDRATTAANARHTSTAQAVLKQTPSIAQAAPQAVLEQCPPSPISDLRSSVPSEPQRRGGPPLALGLRRFKVWHWMLDECLCSLGDHANAFDLDAFLRQLDRESDVIPSSWPWLKDQVLAEARRRGLPFAQAAKAGKQTTALGTALANIARLG